MLSLQSKAQFDQPGYAKYQHSEEFLVKSACGEDYSAELTSVVDFYGDDFDRHCFSAQLTSLAAQFNEAELSEDSNSISITLSHIPKAFLLQSMRSSLK